MQSFEPNLTPCGRNFNLGGFIYAGQRRINGYFDGIADITQCLSDVVLFEEVRLIVQQ